MAEKDIIQTNNDFFVTESTIKKDTPPEEINKLLAGRKATAHICTRMLQGGTASITIVEKTKISKSQRDEIRKILDIGE